MATTGWSTNLTDFVDKASEDISQMARVIAQAMLQEVVVRSPVGRPDLWQANIQRKAKNVSLADAYDANVDARNASKAGKKFKKLTQRERKENFYIDERATGKGYIGGTFRGSHIVSIGAPDFTVTDRVDAEGTATISDGTSAIQSAGLFPVIYIQTNLPYAEALENGHSTQAPSGVYGLAFIGVSEAYK